MFGPKEILIIAIVVLVLFGRGKISALMGDVGKGITSFRKGLKDGAEDVKPGPDDAIDVSPKKKDKAT